MKIRKEGLSDSLHQEDVFVRNAVVMHVSNSMEPVVCGSIKLYTVFLHYNKCYIYYTRTDKKRVGTLSEIDLP